MLFLLTGDVQIGKTRWLRRLVDDLAAVDVSCAGVLAPGVWRQRADDEPDGIRGAAGEGRFEKLGIDNILLPGGKQIPFARRRDLALAEGSFDAGSQSAAAQLVWEISDEAITQVNAHFDTLRAEAGPSAVGGETIAAPVLLVVDELGQLELLRDGGLTSAVALLDAGATPAFPCALAVVREWLLDRAVERFASAWNGVEVIKPDDAARDAVFEALRR